MSRFHQRLRQRLRDPEFAAGYEEMGSELQLVEALNLLREQANLSTEELAQRMGRQRTAVSRLFNASRANPTLDTLSDLLRALGVTAEIHLRPAEEGEPPIQIEMSTPS
jgi:transcriptional regulator with XRE-family HTH domain